MRSSYIDLASPICANGWEAVAAAILPFIQRFKPPDARLIDSH
jgi:hypothetical protein